MIAIGVHNSGIKRSELGKGTRVVLNLKITKLSFHFEGLQREGEGNFLSWMTGPWLGKESESPRLERKPEFQANSPPKISTGANAIPLN